MESSSNKLIRNYCRKPQIAHFFRPFMRQKVHGFLQRKFMATTFCAFRNNNRIKSHIQNE
jgi:hypothetical protein